MLIGLFMVLGAIGAAGIALAEMRDRPLRRAERLARDAVQPAE